MHFTGKGAAGSGDNHSLWPSPIDESLLSPSVEQEGPGLGLKPMAAEKWCLHFCLVGEGGKVVLGASCPHDLGWPQTEVA